MNVYLVEEWGDNLRNNSRFLINATSAEDAFDQVAVIRHDLMPTTYLSIDGSELHEVVTGYLWYWTGDGTAFEVRKLEGVVLDREALHSTGVTRKRGSVAEGSY